MDVVAPRDRQELRVAFVGIKNCDKNWLILENISPDRSSFVELSTYT
jgi:hypothetical protein